MIELVTLPKENSLVFDSGPIISLATNNLLWILEPLRKRFSGEFFITKSVYSEIVEKPIETKRFEFEALQVLRLVREGILKRIDNDFITHETKALVDIANKCYAAKGSHITILHEGELESIAACKFLEAKAIVADERTLRLMIEDPKALGDRLELKLHTKVVRDDKYLKEFKNEYSHLPVIRSVELVFAAYKLGLLDGYLAGGAVARKQLLDAVLWGLKIQGCAVSKEEIEWIVEKEA